jgi:hypothetical protein
MMLVIVPVSLFFCEKFLGAVHASEGAGFILRHMLEENEEWS